jgi:hypothetical protein
VNYFVKKLQLKVETMRGIETRNTTTKVHFEKKKTAIGTGG